MTDIKRFANPLFLRDEDLRQAMEMLYFSYRRFTGEADHVLAAHGFGRAHHRVLYFVGRQPGMTVKQLLTLLEITKQSLARVLKALLDKGLVEQRAGDQDRRERRLYLTATGHEIEGAAAQAQVRLLREAFMSVGPEAVEGFGQVLMGLIPPDHRHRF